MEAWFKTCQAAGVKATNGLAAAPAVGIDAAEPS